MGIGIPIGLETKLDVRAAEAAASEVKALFMRTANEIGGEYSKIGQQMLSAFNGRGFADQQAAIRAEMARTATAELDAARQLQRSYDDVYAARLRANEMVTKYGTNSSQAASAVGRLTDVEAVAIANAKAHKDATEESAAAQDKLGNSATSSATSLASMSTALRVGGVATVALGGLMYETTGKAGDFEQQLMKLHTSAGETTENLKTLSDGVLKMAGQVGYGTGELMNGMYDLEKAGFRGRDALDVLKSAAQGAGAEQADLKEVINGLSTSMNDFNFSAERSADVMSKMVVGAGLARVSFQEFSGGLHSVEPIAANIGKSQGLNDQQMSHLLSDVYGVSAQLTRSGMSAAQSDELAGHAFNKMLGPTQQMRDTLGALGIDAQDLTDHLGERGLAGTLQVVDKAIREHTKDGKVNLDVHYQSAQAARAETQAYNALSPAAKQVADRIKDHTLTYAEFRKSKGGLDVELANEVNQWNALNNKITGFSNLIKSGIGDQLSYDQALKLATGDQETLQVAMQTTGENAASVNDKINQVDKTVREHDGTVKGFNETQETLNAKLRDAKAEFGAAAVQIGNVFIPAMKDVADVLKSVSQFLAAHPGLTHDAIDALEDLAGMWVTVKASMVLKSAFDAILTGFGSMTSASAATSAAIKADAIAEEAALGGLETAAATGAAAIDGIGAAATRTTGLIATLGSKLNILAVGAYTALSLGNTLDQRYKDSTGLDPNDPKNLNGMLNLASQSMGMGDAIPGPPSASYKDWYKDQRAPKPMGPNAADQILNPNGIASTDTPGALTTTINGLPAMAAPEAPKPPSNFIGPVAQPESPAAPAAPAPEPAPPTGVDPTEAKAQSDKIKNSPTGTAHDPVHIRPVDLSGIDTSDTDLGYAGKIGKLGAGGGLGSSGGGGMWSQLASTLTEFLLQLALGNPMGKMAAGGAGGQGTDDLAVTAEQIEKMTPAQRAEMENTIRVRKSISAYKKTLREYAAAVQRYGPGSEQALNAQDSVLSARDGIDETIARADDRAARGIKSDSSQDAIAQKIINAGQARGMPTSVIKSALETGLVESGLRNLNYGDRDSLGVMQQRPSQGWGTAAQVMDPDYAISQFYNHAQAVPGFATMDPGVLAQSVQRSAFPDRYGQQGAAADSYLRRLASGPVNGPGPLGKDSQLALVAPGEYVVPSDQVGAAGGPTGVESRLRGYSDGGPVDDGSGGANNPSYQSRAASGPQQSGGGLDVGGGSLGMAEGAGAMALNALAPGAGEGAQIGMQEANRAAKYGAQVAGIAVQGLFETFALNDSVIGDPSKSWIGRLAGGIAGSHPTNPNSAGASQAPLKPKTDDKAGEDSNNQQQGPTNGVNIEQMHVHNGDGEAVARDINRQTQQYQLNTR